VRYPDFNRIFLSLPTLLLAAFLNGPPSIAAEAEPAPLIKPPVPTNTGLLLEPPLDLSHFTTTQFTALSSSIGANRIHKKWTSPVLSLPPHPRPDVEGLTEPEVKQYMAEARRLFNAGEANPISDAGLISTQEDVIRKPMLNHIAAFSNDVARVYLLVQKQSNETNWGYFSIVQDLTIEPALDYFADVTREIKFQGKSCYKCHSSGPLAIHPAREDLVSDPQLAAALTKHIAKQPLSKFYFPPNEKRLDYGQPLALEFCAKCHDTEGPRQPLYKVHSHPIRVLVDFGYMPPKHPLTSTQIAELKTWLDQKPSGP
jgi:hypothetical protein